MSEPPKGDWKGILDKYFTRLEILGVRAANKAHRGFVNLVLVFIAWNVYSFSVSYNNYWRIRRDPNLPRQWLEEQTAPGEADWAVERDRADRESRLDERKESKKGGFMGYN